MKPCDTPLPHPRREDLAALSRPPLHTTSVSPTRNKRLAIVGCGKIAKTHALALQDLGFDCIAVVDSEPGKAEAFSANYAELRADWLEAAEWRSAKARQQLRGMFPPPRPFTSLETLPCECTPDAVIIATLPPSHCALVNQAARMGIKTILCEKPMAMSARQCREMIDCCHQMGARLAVFNHALLLLRHMAVARSLILTGQIGRVEFIRANTVSSLMDYGSYLWAGIRHLLADEIASVEALLDCSSQTIRYGHVQEDRATVHFTMKSGTHGVLFTERKEFTTHGIRIDGSEGSIEISYLSAPTLRHWRQGMKSWEVVTPPKESSYHELRAFIEGVVNHDPDFAPFNAEEALRSMLPVYAAWQSHVERRTVSLDDSVSFEVPSQF